MQNDPTPVASSPEEFGMTEEDVKNYKMQGILKRIAYYVQKAAPAATKILNAFLYYLIRFVKPLSVQFLG